MAVQKSFDIGHQVTVNITNPLTGDVMSIPNLVHFDKKPRTKELVSNPISSPPVFKYPPDGWSGSFEIDRLGPGLDKLFAALDKAYWAGANIPSCTILEYTQEQDGTVTTYQYTDVALQFADGGAIKSNEKIMQKFNFMAAQRLEIV
jgi:hypothetical protein